MGDPAERSESRFDVRRTGRLFVMIVVLGLLAALVAGLAGRAWWRLDLASHFQVQYFALGAVSIVACAVLRMRRFLGLATVVTIVSAVRVAPWFMARLDRPTCAARPLRLLLINVLTSNPNHERVISYVNEVNADVVVLQEVDERWMQSLEALRAGYPHVVLAPRTDDFGMALLSRVPLRDARIQRLGIAALPTIVATVAHGGADVTILATHPVPPVSERRARWRDEQLRIVADRIAEVAGASILIGDLNATMWSAAYADLVERTGLVDARRGFGVLPTWSQFHPGWLRIPIDHCLVSPGLAVTSCATGPELGSDHLPLVVEVVPGDVIPAQAGIQLIVTQRTAVPACAGMTDGTAVPACAGMTVGIRNRCW